MAQTKNKPDEVYNAKLPPMMEDLMDRLKRAPKRMKIVYAYMKIHGMRDNSNPDKYALCESLSEYSRKSNPTIKARSAWLRDGHILEDEESVDLEKVWKDQANAMAQDGISTYGFKIHRLMIVIKNVKYWFAYDNIAKMMLLKEIDGENVGHVIDKQERDKLMRTDLKFCFPNCCEVYDKTIQVKECKEK